MLFSARTAVLALAMATVSLGSVIDARTHLGTAAPTVSQIFDGQPQAPSAPVSSAAPVSQIPDGQPQAPSAAVSSVAPKITQIGDGQLQVPASGMPKATQIADGQIQVPAAPAVTQIADGQIQQPKQAAGANTPTTTYVTAGAGREELSRYAFAVGLAAWAFGA